MAKSNGRKRSEPAHTLGSIATVVGEMKTHIDQVFAVLQVSQQHFADDESGILGIFDLFECKLLAIHGAHAEIASLTSRLDVVKTAEGRPS